MRSGASRALACSLHFCCCYLYKVLSLGTNFIINNNILEHLDDDGVPIEPKFFLPVIPICLVNGAEGIGTGFSTSIPNYNVKDIIEYITNKLTGEDKKVKLIPYYNNFKGRIFIIERWNKFKKEKEKETKLMRWKVEEDFKKLTDKYSFDEKDKKFIEGLKAIVLSPI